MSPLPLITPLISVRLTRDRQFPISHRQRKYENEVLLRRRRPRFNGGGVHVGCERQEAPANPVVQGDPSAQ